MFNIIDLFIVLVVLAQAIRWARLGLLRGIFPLAGFVLGIVLGANLAPRLIDLAQDPTERLLVTLTVVIGLAIVGSAIGEFIGAKLSKLRKVSHLRYLDNIAGVVFSAGLSLFVIWILAALITAGPFQGINQLTRDSAILQAMDQRLPPAPEALSRIGNLIDQEGFPQVFSGLEPRPVEPVDLPDSPQIQAAVAAAGASTVRLESLGCGGIVNGSGFVIAPGLVMTNAHVVAGIENPTIVDTAGSRSSVPVYFDPRQDIAILRTDGLAGPPLELAGEEIPRGTQAVTLGYPGGGPLTAEGTGVLRQLEATGRDIYGQSIAVRSIYELQAVIHSGNSGGPVVTEDGTVIGMIFARSTSERNIAYALRSPGLTGLAETHRDSQQPVSTGSCL